MSDNAVLLSRPPTDPLRRFLVWGFVVGNELPHDLELPHVRIKHLSDAEYARLEKSHTSVTHPEFDERPSRSGVPADVKIRSRWGILVWVDATDTEAAHRAAEDDLIPPVLALLSCLTADPVEVDLVRVVELDAPGSEDSNPISPWSRSGFFRVAEPQPLRPETERELRRLLSATRSDKVARKAAQALASAIALEPQTGGLPENIEAVLLRYFFVVEGVARRIGHGEKDQKRADAAQADLITEIRRNLAKPATPKQHEAQIRQAVRKLDVLARKYLGDQIDHAGQVLQLPQAIVEEAHAFVQLRNSRLGHAGRTNATGDEVRSWLERARPVAFAFLLGYARAISNETIT